MRFLTIAVLALTLLGCGRSDLLEDLDNGAPADGGPDSDARADGDARPDAPPDGQGPCVTANDCDDGVVCTQDSCAAGICQHTPKDSDNDGFPDQTCGGTDCDDLSPDVHPGAPETCGDKRDNDCNGLVDCADPACQAGGKCRCAPTEDCTNKIDDDCNGLTDCQDPACKSLPACSNCQTTETSCTDKIDNDCNGLTDCKDPACIGTKDCGCNQPEDCTNGADDNCDGKIDCDDPECATTPGCTCHSSPENCVNGIDDNCNGVIDCLDTSCYADPACSCAVRPPSPEVCGNSVDDDCNGKTDCADPACTTDPRCKTCVLESCANGKDDDCNGLIDCADPACRFAPNCAPTPEQCDNGIDDDHNGYTDCEDPACKTNPLCVLKHEFCNSAQVISASGNYFGTTVGFVNRQKGSCGGAAGEAVYELEISAPSRVHLDTKGTGFDSVLYVRAGACASGRELACDDDSNGSHAAVLDFPILYPGNYFVFVDGFAVDPPQADEGTYNLNVEITQNPTEICGNGVDDDGNHLADCADPACSATAACATCNGGAPGAPELGIFACTNGQDDDCDGKSDCADPDCHASSAYPTECCNGKDDNGNGFVDEFACVCRGNGDCSNGNLCYTDSTYTCSADCTFVFGDICPYAVPGSTCSAATRQCEWP